MEWREVSDVRPDISSVLNEVVRYESFNYDTAQQYERNGFLNGCGRLMKGILDSGSRSHHIIV